MGNFEKKQVLTLDEFMGFAESDIEEFCINNCLPALYDMDTDLDMCFSSVQVFADKIMWNIKDGSFDLTDPYFYFDEKWGPKVRTQSHTSTTIML